MALRFSDTREELVLLQTEWKVESKNAIAILTDLESSTSSSLKYPLEIVEDKEDYSSCQVFLFKNRFYSREDHCYNLKIGDKRCGMIFPMKIYNNSSQLPASDSDKSAFFSYKFFHIAFYHLITDINLPSKPIKFEKLFDENLQITDFYDEETIVFIYHDGEDNSISKIKKMYPSLLKFGYVPLHSETEFGDIEMINIEAKDHPFYNQNILDTITLKETKSNIIEEKFIEHIFSSVLKFNLTPLSKFVLLYQVIELLIDKIAFEHYQKNVLSISSMSIALDLANKAKSFRNIFSSLKDVQQKLEGSVDKIKTEEKRINILFNEKCNLKIVDYNAFANLAQNVIGKNRHCSLLPEYVYQLRNKIIHDYHNLTSEHDDIDSLMSKLNLEFEQLISDVIIEFS